MFMVIVLIVMVVGSVALGIWNPWGFPEIASNWGGIDLTVNITFVVTGIVFVLVSIFLIYCVWKFRYKEDNRADYEPENERLEFWLTMVTTVGVVAMLAPGLLVWDDYVTVPDDAREVEVVAAQWRWSYRFPGADGKLGTVHARNISFDNPFGMNDNDPNGEDDVLVQSPHLYVPIHQPIKVLLRSTDVLHDFMVPDIRAKMDSVPGMITYFWFEPTKLGEYEVLCAELCGNGHYNMRGKMTIATPEEFDRWLDSYPTWAELKSGVANRPSNPVADRGREVAETNGCFACHTLDGSQTVGPTWQNLWGSTRTMSDGSSVVVDEAYLEESIREPNAKLVEGFPAAMIPYALSPEDMEALIEYIRFETGPQDDARPAGDTR